MESPISPGPRNASRAARAEAAAWIVRLHGPHRSPEVEAGFRAWLAAHPDNSREFERVTEVWDAGATLPVAGLPRVARWREAQASNRWALAATILLLFAVGLWGLDQFWRQPSYETRLGEQRLVRLDDGSRITLNSNTLIRIACCDDERQVRLERGEAYFEVARDTALPFVVVAGDHQVIALGTAFVVRYEASRTAVTLVEGKVAVSGTGIEDPGTATQLTEDSHVLAPGQRVTFMDRAAARVDLPRIEAVTAWRRGEVMLDRTTLAEAVAEMNRYDERRLVIDDPKVAALLVSGIYHAGDTMGFARTVAKLYALDVVEQPGRIHLVRTVHTVAGP
jgi:transmembrane sensor